MTAIKRSRLALLSLLLAAASLLGVFAILDASSASASMGEAPQPQEDYQPDIIIMPPELEATLYPDELLTQTLWITNTTNIPITYTIYEMTSSLQAAGFSLMPKAAPVIDPEALAQVEAEGSALVFISLRELPDLSQAYLIPDKSARRRYAYNRLQETTSHSQDLFDWLVAQGTHPERFLAANTIAATLDPLQLAQVANDPLVRQVKPNRQVYRIVESQTSPVQSLLPPLPTVKPDAVEWNIAMIRADDAWRTFGITGEGAVVGIMDTGAMYDHPALVNSYRGSLGGGAFDHNFNWYDFVLGEPVPYDGMGHGTMITGIVSGDDGGTNQIGVAPGANWIAAKVCSDQGICDYDSIYHGFEWMIAPTDLDGNNADPTKAPDIVFGGWGGGSCDDQWLVQITYLRAAGILPIFPGGHSGPACSSISSLGDRPYVLTAGMTDQNDTISDLSPRGPACGGLIRPDVVAPGENIRSSFNNGDYTVWSGSAESSAHAAGVAALMISADPYLAAGLIEPILYATSECHDDLACGGELCPGPNNVYGHGRIDAYEAVYAALGNPPHTELPWLNEAPISGTIPVSGGVSIEVTFDATGLAPGSYTGALGIVTNDPVQPFSSVPVSLDVLSLPTPVISINPLSFSATLPVGGTQTDTLTIRNDGDAVLQVNLYEIPGPRSMSSQAINLSFADPYPANLPVKVDAGVNPQLLFLGRSRLILYLRGGLDLSPASSLTDRAERGQYVYDQLLALASQSQELFTWLQAQGTDPHRLLTANAIAATLDAAQLEMVLNFPQVGRVSIDGYSEVLDDGSRSLYALQSLQSSPNTVEWNIARIRADETWATFGVTGEGAVVGEIDTGVMYNHEALVNSYRGNLGGGVFDHDHNWFDFVAGLPVPYDDAGHGTMGMGVAVGDDGGDDQIGVAPGAKWIAVKACGSGLGCSDEDLHAALEWMLAPTDLAGNNPDPSLAPQVVLNMWGGAFGCVDQPFEMDLLALQAANILPVFAPGGEGPACGTVAYPASDPKTLSAGSTDMSDLISPFSSTGPSCIDGGIKPDIVAPGQNIRSSAINGSYQIWNGTSLSTAHLAGAAALVFSADQNISLQGLEQNLFETASCHEDLLCGGDPCPGANNIYGHGLIDVFEAVSMTLGTTYDVPWLTAGPLEVELQPGEGISTSVVVDAGTLEPGIYHAGVAVESNDPLATFTVLPVTLTVSAPCQPLEDLFVSYTPSDPKVDELVTFSASAGGTTPITYTWTFEDGWTAIGPLVTYTFTSPGAHLVHMVAENACTDPMMMEFNVPVQPLIQKFMLPLVIK